MSIERCLSKVLHKTSDWATRKLLPMIMYHSEFREQSVVDGKASDILGNFLRFVEREVVGVHPPPTRIHAPDISWIPGTTRARPTSE